MKNIDRRITYKIVLDTETCPIDTSVNDVDAKNMFVYDVGWVVTDKRGTVYEKRSYVNADIFLDEKELMKSAYYSKKIPEYWDNIRKGTSTLATFYNIRKALLEDIAEYEITEVYGHNIQRFDLNTLNVTERWLTKSKYRYFFPYGIQIKDTLAMATDVIGKMPTFKKFCEKNGYMTKHKTPRPQMTAEVLYRFMKKDTSFVEEHKGLDDVMIEKEIMAYCYRQHKKMRQRFGA